MYYYYYFLFYIFFSSKCYQKSVMILSVYLLVIHTTKTQNQKHYTLDHNQTCAFTISTFNQEEQS